MSPFPAPASSHAACGFPALRAPAHFASRVMGPKAFALTYTLRLSSCRLTDESIGSPLPRFVERRSCVQQGPFAPRALPRFNATTDPAATVSSSVDFPVMPVYTTYLAPDMAAWDEDGFSSCLACPCHRAVPTTPPEEYVSSASLRHDPTAFVPDQWTRPLGLFLSGPPSGSLVLRPGDSLTAL